MHLGVAVPNRGAAAVHNVRTLPPIVEATGFHSVWFTDHVVGVRSFEPVYGPAWAEALTSIAYAAAITSSVRLGIGVLVAPYRDPVLAAKMLTTIDGLTDGRLDIGIGTGWARSEFHALGRGELFDTRGSFTDEAIDVMVRCFEGGEFGWDGKWVQFRRMQAEPRPVQQPHPPLWIGANAGAALRRAARLADVWHPTRLPPEDIGRIGAELDAMARRPVPRSARVRVALGTPVAETVDLLRGYERAGCVEVVMELHTEDAADVRSWAEAIASAWGLTGARDSK
jgi:probable F420-dependent oxidoreductase